MLRGDAAQTGGGDVAGALEIVDADAFLSPGQPGQPVVLISVATQYQGVPMPIAQVCPNLDAQDGVERDKAGRGDEGGMAVEGVVIGEGEGLVAEGLGVVDQGEWMGRAIRVG